jgi:hypothetical protein
MKSFLSRALLVLSVLVLTACTITPKVTETENKAVRLACTTATPGFDGIAVTACAIDAQKVDGSGKNVPDSFTRSVHMYQSVPTLSNVAVGVTNGMGAAGVQGYFLKEATKIGKCDPGANCGNVFNVQGGQSQSGSEANAVSNTAVNVRSSVGGMTGGCGAACKPNHAQ